VFVKVHRVGDWFWMVLCGPVYLEICLSVTDRYLCCNAVICWVWHHKYLSTAFHYKIHQLAFQRHPLDCMSTLSLEV